MLHINRKLSYRQGRGRESCESEMSKRKQATIKNYRDRNDKRNASSKRFGWGRVEAFGNAEEPPSIALDILSLFHCQKWIKLGDWWRRHDDASCRRFAFWCFHDLWGLSAENLLSFFLSFARGLAEFPNRINKGADAYLVQRPTQGHWYDPARGSQTYLKRDLNRICLKLRASEHRPLNWDDTKTSWICLPSWNIRKVG